MIDVTMATFQHEVLNKSIERPVLIDFWAPWCGPCRIVGPILDKLHKEANGRWHLAKINTESETELASHFRVTNIPALKIVSEGKIVAEHNGALPEPALKEWIEKSVPNPETLFMHSIIEARKVGDLRSAKIQLQALIERNPANTEAVVMLAEVLFGESPQDALSLVDAIDSGHQLHDRVQALRTLNQFVFANGLPTDEADDIRSLFNEAASHFKNLSYGDAADTWIRIVRKNRKAREDGARRACIALFEWLGNQSTVTREYRSQLSSALF